MATRPTTGQSWNDQSVPIPRDENGCTPPLYTNGVAQNFGTQDDDAHRRPTKVDEHGRVTSGDPR